MEQEYPLSELAFRLEALPCESVSAISWKSRSVQVWELPKVSALESQSVSASCVRRNGGCYLYAGHRSACWQLRRGRSW